MKVLYITYSGHAYAEEVHPGFRQVELPDGFHVVTAGSVWRDCEHKKDAIMLVRQGITAPEGDALVRSTIYETERLKYHYRGINTGRMWTRRLLDALIKLFYVSAVSISLIAIFLTTWVFVYVWTGVSLLG